MFFSELAYFILNESKLKIDSKNGGKQRRHVDFHPHNFNKTQRVSGTVSTLSIHSYFNFF